ncbi:DUF4920 domain-containing protein [Sphingobacterium psychroaquaticum]|uniref:DUF4920 domain-containing protein n=1 Tax=Sphingobacterium psychroaquaticum TaxID=561061 RepID=UPI00106D6093|nr:DUF4920 domain-containing protein [Sphingobacterium psychroaquaticum]QBQ42441.1 DUF4920 domain-containing protein [Sphingobacterium psychroaquaticum]
MKKIIGLLFCVLVSLQLSQAQQKIEPAKAGVQYGKKIDAKNAISVNKLENNLKKSETFTGKIEGEVVEVCKKKGCFMTLKRDNGETIMVRFTDYGYFVPADLIGKKVAVEGRAKVKETSVEWLKHYAEDKGASKEEIAKISKPKTDINIVADGVYVIK